MTKNELIYKVADRLNTTKEAAKNSIDAVFECIYATAEDGEKVHVGAFVFKKVERAARKGRNPKTGEAIDIPASASIVCRVKL